MRFERCFREKLGQTRLSRSRIPTIFTLSTFRQVSTVYGKEGETLSVSGSTEPVSYTYDGLYRLFTLKDGGNHVTSYFYNTYGYLAQVVYPGAQGTPPTAPLTAGSSDTVTFNGYDADGNLLSRTDGRNQTTTYAYSDNESKLTGISYPSGTIGAVGFTYDSYGRHSSMSDGTGSQAYSYDDANDLTQKSVTWTGLSAKTINYAFYPNGTQSAMTADGNAFSYSYDKDGRMTGLVNPYSEPSAWAYRDNGWLQTKTLGNASSATVAATTYTQNALGEVTDLLNQSGTGTTLSEFGSMAYDGAGNRTTLTASVPGNTAYSGTTSYAYDYGQTATASRNRSQVTGETSTRNGGYTNGYSYDGGTSTGAGNPTSFKGGTNTFNADNQITSFQNSSGQSLGTFAYDGAGNPTTYKSAALTFDPENRMTSYAGTTQTDGYSGDGLRAWKTNSGGTTYFLYDGTKPVCEYNNSGALTATNTFGADGLASRHTSNASTFYAFDERGNMAQRLNSSSVVQSSDLYDGYGSQSSTGGADVWGFEAQAGCYADSETGLILCTHRFCDPTTGRWLTRDPISYKGGINLYGYLKNSSINGVDPSGLDGEVLAIGVIALAVILGVVNGIVNWSENGQNPKAFWCGFLGGAVGTLASFIPGCVGAGVGAFLTQFITIACTNNWSCWGRAALRGLVSAGIAVIACLAAGGSLVAGVVGAAVGDALVDFFCAAYRPCPL